MPRLLILLTAALFFAGCDLFGDDDKPAGPAVSGVFVASQGNFSEGNGSISTYDPRTNLASPDAIENVGSVVQSVFVQDTLLYVIANTGGRVDVYGAAGLQKRGSIAGLVSPRYMAATDTLGFVTNLYGDAATFSGGTVSVLNLRTGRKIRDVAVGDNPEGIAIAGNRVYVANSGFGMGRTVSVLDARTGLFEKTLDVDCDGPRSLAADAEGEVWVFCSGQTLYDANFNVVGKTGGAVRILDSETGAIVGRFGLEGQIGAASFGQDVFYSARAQSVFVVEEGRTVRRYDTRRNAFVDSFTVAGAPIGAIAYDAARETLYLGRVEGYTAAGTVTLHRPDGTAAGSFVAGIIPTFIAFRETR